MNICVYIYIYIVGVSGYCVHLAFIRCGHVREIGTKSDRCPRVCYYYAEMLRLSVVQKMRDVSSETPMCYD